MKDRTQFGILKEFARGTRETNKDQTPYLQRFLQTQAYHPEQSRSIRAMEYVKEETITTLNDLLKTCSYSEERFRSAAEFVQSWDMRELFNIYSAQRRQFAIELQAEIYLLGSDPHNGRDFSGALRQGWMDIWTALTTNDDDAIIAECRRGEDFALRKYEEALTKDLTDDARALASRQYARITETQDQMCNLEKGSVALR